MAMKMKKIEYGAPAKQILAIPDHYVALGFKHAKATSAAPGLATLVDGRYVVKAGTIYPANNSTAIGVVLNDYDVTDGDAMMAVVIHGFIKTAALPAVPVADAIAAMKQITFNPLISIGLALTGTKAAITVGATADPDPVVFKLANATFRDGAETLTNWTITGKDTTKVEVTKIEVAADGQTVTFTLDQKSAAVAGNVKVLPSASIISTGKTLAAAVAIATVAAA
jgi:hypothetical protein